MQQKTQITEVLKSANLIGTKPDFRQLAGLATTAEQVLKASKQLRFALGIPAIGPAALLANGVTDYKPSVDHSQVDTVYLRSLAENMPVSIADPID